MGVYIKGIEIPKNCAVCILEKDLFGRAVCFGYEDGRALYKDDLPPVGSEERRPSWCPLVLVPPHGRLIDADALMGRIEHDTPLSSTFEKVVRRYIKDAPTIIPAEEDET